MKLGIMQPYFLPYLGYYSLIKCSDKWIFNDQVQMIRQGWIERNRILKQQGGWHYIRVPLVKFSHTTPIKYIQIRNDEDWKGKILDQLKHYKNKAPYYKKVIKLLDYAFKVEFETITVQNAYLLELTCEYIGFDFNFEVLSKLDIDLPDINEPDEWSLIICKTLGYNHYINPILGKQFYNRKKYEDNNIKLNFLRMDSYSYDQGSKEFVDGLSIIDVMMFNSPAEINQMLDKYQLDW